MRSLAVLIVALALAASAAACNPRPTLAALEGEIICPVCHTTLDQSDAPIARRMKQFIAARIAAGDSDCEIKAKLVAQFGPAVLAAPPKRGFDLLAWWLPVVGILAAAGILAALAWRWSRNRDAAPMGSGPPLQPELDRRLDDELARFEDA